MQFANRFTHGVLHRWYSNKAMGYAYYTVWPTVSPNTRPAFIASVAPTKSAEEERAYFYTPPTHYGRGVGVNAHGETLHNGETTMCGRCGASMRAHTESCDRDFEQDFGSYDHDYYQYGPVNYDRNPRTFIVPFEDYSGYADDSDSEEFYRDSEWQSVYDLGDYSTEDLYWKDGNERECTEVLVDVQFTGASVKGTAINGTHGFPLPEGMYIDTSAIVAQSKTVYVEGIAGYHSIKLLDLFITAKSHAKMLNVYKRDGILRIGGLKLFPSQEHEPDFPGMVWTKVEAECGHYACRYQDERRNWKQRSFSIAGYELTREQQEDFVYFLIQHGNNHAAPWFQERTHARATHKVVQHTTFQKVGTRWLEDEDGFYEVGVYADEPVHSTTSKGPWRIEIAKDTPTFYKVHERDCSLSCDPLKVACS